MTKSKNGLIRDILWPKHSMVTAVEDISFSVEKGEAVAFLGPNGAGKTTTMKMLSGLIHPTSGHLSVMGFTPFDRKRDFLCKIGLVMGNKSSLEWDLSARQSFELLKKIYKIPQEKFVSKVKQLTQLLNTNELLDKPIRKLSLGERLKMELISSLLYEPEILFLDEPTIGLDVTSKQKIRDFLRHIQKEFKVTLLLTSHDMDDIEKVCDRVIVINKGQKVYDDSLFKLTQKYNQEKHIKVIFKIQPDEEALEKFGLITEKNELTYIIKIQTEFLSEFLAELTGKFEIADIDMLPIPLDEIISDIYQKTSKS